MSASALKLTFTGAIVGGAVAVSAASAATINVTYQDPNNIFGTPDYSQQVVVDAPGDTADGTVNAGPFRLTGDNGFGDFVAFCIDLTKRMTTGADYAVQAGSTFGANVDHAIDRLFTSAYAGIDTADKGAAFQVALWEIITDTGTGGFNPADYDLSSGGFQARPEWAHYGNGFWNYNTDVSTLATQYLNGLAGAGTGGYNLTFLNSGGSQNLVTVSPVPVPAALGMLGIGLAGLFGVGRRKKA